MTTRADRRFLCWCQSTARRGCRKKGRQLDQRPAAKGSQNSLTPSLKWQPRYGKSSAIRISRCCCQSLLSSNCGTQETEFLAWGLVCGSSVPRLALRVIRWKQNVRMHAGGSGAGFPSPTPTVFPIFGSFLARFWRCCRLTDHPSVDSSAKDKQKLGVDRAGTTAGRSLGLAPD